MTSETGMRGAVWHRPQQAEYWTDIDRFLIHRYTLDAERVRSWLFDEPVTALTLTDRDETLAEVLGSKMSKLARALQPFRGLLNQLFV